MSLRFPRLLFGSLATAAMLAFGNPAVHATVFVSSAFDPFSFSGTGVFKLDDACFSLGDGWHAVNNSGPCSVALMSANVSVIALSPDPPGTAQLDFPPTSPDFGIWGIYLVGGEIKGVDSFLIGEVFSASCTGSLCNGAPWWIEWVSGHAPDEAAQDPVNLYTGTCPTITAPKGADNCVVDYSSVTSAPNVTFTRIPEPGTISLILAALGAGGFLRRRRAAA